MRFGVWTHLAAVLVGGVLAGGWLQHVGAEESTRRTKPEPKPVTVSDFGDVQRVLNQILKNEEQILANQQTMSQRFDAVMEELRIIKVRATIRSGS